MGPRLVDFADDRAAFTADAGDPETFAEAWRHWQDLRGTDPLPSRASFDPMSIVALMRTCVWADVLTVDPIDVRFSYVGGLVDDRMGCNLNRRTISEMRTPGKSCRIIESFRLAVEKRCPVVTACDYIGPIEGIEWTAELYLPFCGAADAVTNVWVVVHFVGDRHVPAIEMRWSKPA